jgi:hypothetical protein
MPAQRTANPQISAAYRVRYWMGVALIVTFAPFTFMAEALGGTTAFFAVGVGYGYCTMLLRCPSCRWPLFRRGALWFPWPTRNCGNCSVAPAANTQRRND